mmetsp:Transcript_2089/g.7071  ORF Transcript_2089/g.7071 Transcript_2089/m.7071 type:complete len:279 (+) Transcript_2089:2099-2935(+)
MNQSVSQSIFFFFLFSRWSVRPSVPLSLLLNAAVGESGRRTRSGAVVEADRSILEVEDAVSEAKVGLSALPEALILDLARRGGVDVGAALEREPGPDGGVAGRFEGDDRRSVVGRRAEDDAAALEVGDGAGLGVGEDAEATGEGSSLVVGVGSPELGGDGPGRALAEVDREAQEVVGVVVRSSVDDVADEDFQARGGGDRRSEVPRRVRFAFAPPRGFFVGSFRLGFGGGGFGGFGGVVRPGGAEGVLQRDDAVEHRRVAVVFAPEVAEALELEGVFL